MNIQESGEMYLETILVLSRRLSQVRSIDICDEMGYSKPSVSRAVGLLKSGGFITVDDGGYITLTAEGERIAAKIFERHTILTELLIHMGVDSEIASRDACKLEHAISDESLSAIKDFLEKIN